MLEYLMAFLIRMSYKPMSHLPDPEMGDEQMRDGSSKDNSVGTLMAPEMGLALGGRE